MKKTEKIKFFVLILKNFISQTPISLELSRVHIFFPFITTQFIPFDRIYLSIN